YGGVHDELLKELGATGFVGYDRLSASAEVKALVKDGARVDALAQGEQGEVVLSLTPFYAEMGGEVGDTGTIEAEGLKLEVVDTKAPAKGLVCHSVKVVEGTVREGDAVRAVVDELRRKRITRNHTCTHLLHAALRRVLGEHVKQAGSYVGPDRLRFDITHFEGMTSEQIAEVERVANEAIMQATPTTIYETSLDAARESGVTGLFGEKYGDIVRVVEAGEFSRELCGGCHVANTAEIGFVKIVSEASVGANVRRIEAVTSFDALAHMNRIESELKEAAAELKVPMFDVSERTAANIRAIKEFEAKQKQAKKAAAEGNVAEHIKAMVDVGYPLVIARIDGLDSGALRNAWDILRSRMPKPGACVIGTVNDDKPVIMAAGTEEAVAAGFNAGALIKQIASNIKGGGGGKPTMAQAGGKDASGMDAALDAARQALGA
ncbi:MAG: alanine--tRNA ligase-related protein, partial [Slackia sp.]